MGAFVIVTQLSDLLNGTGVSARQAAEKARELGVHLPYGTAAGYWSGRHPVNPSEETLEGLAAVTNVSLRRLRRAAGFAAGETEPYRPPAEANRLTQRQRAALDDLIKAIVNGVSDSSEPSLKDRAPGHIDEDPTGGLGAVGRG
jgi:transcriptional regulator with XRE-family HTH domain